MHELAAHASACRWCGSSTTTQFEGPAGRRTLPEMFEDRSQLILYRFFFEEGVDGWPDAGCPGCSSFADGIPDLGLLHARDITFAMASPAPQANLRRYAERMGWTDVPWYTICTERFSADFGVDEWFGLNVFLRDGDEVYRTYFLQHGEMVQSIGSVWSMMSLTPYGAQSDDEDVPEGWPQAPFSFWFRRHDEFNECRRRPAHNSARRSRDRAFREGLSACHVVRPPSLEPSAPQTARAMTAIIPITDDQEDAYRDDRRDGAAPCVGIGRQRVEGILASLMDLGVEVGGRANLRKMTPPLPLHPDGPMRRA